MKLHGQYTQEGKVALAARTAEREDERFLCGAEPETSSLLHENGFLADHFEERENEGCSAREHDHHPAAP